MFNFTFKNMKLALGRYKFIVLIFLALLIIIPILVFGDSYTYLTGYPSIHNVPRPLPDITNISRTRTCVFNTSANDYFVPTKTVGEWDAFLANKPSGVTTGACCGDLICNNGETFASCPGDGCSSCGDYICNNGETRATCSSDCCTDASQCGTSTNCGVDTTCSGTTQSCSLFRTYSCNGSCSYSDGLKTSRCGGGENSMCDSGACTNKCSNQYPYGFAGDNDSDTFADAKDPDCGGCGDLCTGGATSGCNPNTNCYANGGSCTDGGIWLNGQCMGQAGACVPACSGYTPVCSNHTCEDWGQPDCPPGYYGANGSCTECQYGYWSYENSGVDYQCYSCSANSQCLYGVEIPCPSGTGNNGGVNTCDPFSGYNGDYSS